MGRSNWVIVLFAGCLLFSTTAYPQDSAVKGQPNKKTPHTSREKPPKDVLILPEDRTVGPALLTPTQDPTSTGDESGEGAVQKTKPENLNKEYFKRQYKQRKTKVGPWVGDSQGIPEGVMSNNDKFPTIFIGMQGVGGVTFFNGSIFDETTDPDTGVERLVVIADGIRIDVVIAHDVGVDGVIADDVRADGAIWRGPSKGTGDGMPLKISDTEVPTITNSNELGSDTNKWSQGVVRLEKKDSQGRYRTVNEKPKWILRITEPGHYRIRTAHGLKGAIAGRGIKFMVKEKEKESKSKKKGPNLEDN
jgi:hypothetical protein